MKKCHCGWEFDTRGVECPACRVVPMFDTNLEHFEWAKENNDAILPKYLHEAYLDWRYGVNHNKEISNAK